MAGSRSGRPICGLYRGESADARYHAAQAEAAKSNDGGGMGWLIWIGLLVLINLLSYLFNWPFWIY